MASEAPVPSPTRATGRVQKLALGASQTLVCSSRLSPAVLGGEGVAGAVGSRPCPGALPVVRPSPPPISVSSSAPSGWACSLLSVGTTLALCPPVPCAWSHSALARSCRTWPRPVLSHPGRQLCLHD